MIQYLYACSLCNERFLVSQSIKDNPYTQCFDTTCSGVVNRIITGGSAAIIYGEATTLGVLGNRNTKRMGRSWAEDKTIQQKLIQKQAREAAKDELRKKLPQGVTIPDTSGFEGPQWYRKEDKPDLSLASLSPEAKTRYILEGKKPL